MNTERRRGCSRSSPRLQPAATPLARVAAWMCCAAFATGCAATSEQRSAHDPFEPFNRAVYQFNDTVDRAVVRPTAVGYQTVVPGPVRTCISNVFSNLGQLWSAANALLQGEGGETARTLLRFATNTTFGFGGCLDIVGTVPGLERKNRDFGQTLGKWGVPSGPYLVLPLMGPSTVRDAVGLVPEFYTDPVWTMNDVAGRNSASALRLVSKRADLLDASRLLEGAALDPYSFLRDGYLQRRRSLIHDGEPPEETLPNYDDDGAADTPPAPAPR